MAKRMPDHATWFSREFLMEAEDLLATSGRRIVFQHDRWIGGTYYLDVHAPDLEAAVRFGDLVQAGFHLMHDPVGRTSAGTRVYRVVCENGELALHGRSVQVAFDSDAPPHDWSEQLADAVARSLSRPMIEAHTARLQRASRQTEVHADVRLAALVGARRISRLEAEMIRNAFVTHPDRTLYGFVNAVTATAHAWRQRARWDRAHAMERLGGEIVSGTETPAPVAAVPVG